MIPDHVQLKAVSGESTTGMILFYNLLLSRFI